MCIRDSFWPPPVHFGLSRESHLFSAQVGYLEAKTRAAQFLAMQDELKSLELANRACADVDAFRVRRIRQLKAMLVESRGRAQEAARLADASRAEADDAVARRADHLLRRAAQRFANRRACAALRRWRERTVLLARRLRRVLLRMSHRGLVEAFDALRRFARAELARLRVMRRVVQRATRLALAAALASLRDGVARLSLIHISEPTRPY